MFLTHTLTVNHDLLMKDVYVSTFTVFQVRRAKNIWTPDDAHVQQIMMLKGSESECGVIFWQRDGAEQTHTIWT